MKPVNLNELLFHNKTDSLSFYIAPNEEIETFLKDIYMQLTLQNKFSLANLLNKSQGQIRKNRKTSPDKVQGVFISSELQGYVILDQEMDSYCIISKTFHVRPLLEEVFVNPDFMLVNVSLYDVKIYRGDFKQIEILQQYEFDELPNNFGDPEHRVFAPQYMGLIPYKTILALKTIASKVTDLILYHSLPVIVTGLEEMKVLFLKYFNQSLGVITHFQEDFYEKTCVEISLRCKKFRYAIIDYYSSQFKERLKKIMNSPKLLTELSDVIKATYEGRVVHLVIPTERKLWGNINQSTGEYVLHKRVNKKTSIDILNELAEEVIQNGGRIQILGPHFFPQNANVMAIIKG